MLQLSRELPEREHDYPAHCRRRDFLATKLDYAWSMAATEGKQRTEIKIIRENSVAVITGPREDFAIRGGSSTALTPMTSFLALRVEDCSPRGR